MVECLLMGQCFNDSKTKQEVILSDDYNLFKVWSER